MKRTDLEEEDRNYLKLNDALVTYLNTFDVDYGEREAARMRIVALLVDEVQPWYQRSMAW